jgi:diguanylate cyclase (GGDEF)-like protein
LRRRSCFDIISLHGPFRVLAAACASIPTNAWARRARPAEQRMGGDEFAILQAGATDHSQATKLAERLEGALAKPHSVLGHQITVGASIGIALAPKDSCDPEVLMKKADLALYSTKTSGLS